MAALSIGMTDDPDDDQLKERLRIHREALIEEQMAESEVDRISAEAITAALDEEGQDALQDDRMIHTQEPSCQY